MPVRSKKKKELKEQGYVFEATGKSVSEIHTEELVGKTVEFDAHDVTAKIMEFGKVLTGISLYSYQEDIAYGIIYSVITFSGDVKTVLLSRQSGKSEVMAFVIDTLCVILPALASNYSRFRTVQNRIPCRTFRSPVRPGCHYLFTFNDPTEVCKCGYGSYRPGY